MKCNDMLNCFLFQTNSMCKVSTLPKGILLLTWFNVNPSMDKEITCSVKSGMNCTVEVWEWIIYFIIRIMVFVITYPCWDQS